MCFSVIRVVSAIRINRELRMAPRNLLTVSLTLILYFTLVKTACIQEPPCLKTRVLQSSPPVPQNTCTACEEKSRDVEKENYALVPIHRTKSNQQQMATYQPQNYVPGSNYQRKPSHQPLRSSQLVNYNSPSCKSGPNCQSNYYVLHSTTQVINHIQAPKHQKPQSNVPVSHEPSMTQPSYQSQGSYSVPIYRQASEEPKPVTPLYHLASSNIVRRPNAYRSSPKKQVITPKYQPVKEAYSTRPKVSTYGSAASIVRETKKSVVENASYQAKKTCEKKTSYGKTPARQTIEISCEKCQKNSYEKPNKVHQDSRIKY